MDTLLQFNDKREYKDLGLGGLHVITAICM